MTSYRALDGAGLPRDITVYRDPDDLFGGVHLWVRDEEGLVTITCNNARAPRETCAIPAELLEPLVQVLAQLVQQRAQ